MGLDGLELLVEKLSKRVDSFVTRVDNAAEMLERGDHEGALRQLKSLRKREGEPQ